MELLTVHDAMLYSGTVHDGVQEIDPECPCEVEQDVGCF